MKIDKIDKIDKEIIANLYIDGRATFTSLGEQLGPVLKDEKEKMSHVAVQKRLSKLIENEIIKIQANLNTAQMNYISAIILIETKDYDAQKRIIERFRLCPRIEFMDLVSGKYNLILRASTPSLKEMECFLNYSYLKKEEGMRNMEIYISMTNVKPKFIPIQFYSINKLNKIAPCGHRCNFCDLYKSRECAGCPATIFPELQKQEINAEENSHNPISNPNKQLAVGLSNQEI